MQKNNLALPEVTESQIVFDKFLKIRQDKLHFQDKTDHYYYTLLTPASAVIILAQTRDNRFILNEEYRHTVRTFLLCCPGGYLNHEEESPEEAAQRELQEETGYSAERIEPLGFSFPYPGISAQKVYYVMAHGVEKTAQPKPETSEIFRTVELSYEELLKEIKKGRAIDGTLCTALFYYANFAEKGAR